MALSGLRAMTRTPHVLLPMPPVVQHGPPVRPNKRQTLPNARTYTSPTCGKPGEQLMTDYSTLERRVRTLEDRLALRELAARYAVSMDNRDLEGLGQLFTIDGRLRTQDGAMDLEGRDAIVEAFRGRFVHMGPSNHFCHDHLVQFDESDPDLASGMISAHAELSMGGRALVAAIRYQDTYRRETGNWRFSSRLATFFYFMPADEYTAILGTALRVRVRPEPAPADYPEALASWRDFYGNS